MAGMTDAQINFIRASLGGPEGFGARDPLTDQVHFSNADLERNCEYVGGPQYLEALLGLCFRQLIAKHAGYVDVQGAEASIKNSQLVRHLQAMFAIYKDALEDRIGRFSQIVVVGVDKTVKYSDLDIPLDELEDEYYDDAGGINGNLLRRRERY